MVKPIKKEPEKKQAAKPTKKEVKPAKKGKNA